MARADKGLQRNGTAREAERALFSLKKRQNTPALYNEYIMHPTAQFTMSFPEWKKQRLRKR
jgi:hypothetical protein